MKHYLIELYEPSLNGYVWNVQAASSLVELINNMRGYTYIIKGEF